MSTIGEKLRNERERQGLDLRDIEQATSIRLRYLKAIEDGEYAVLPGDVYAKGFIRNYAATLGFDGPEFVNMYKEESAQIQQPSPVTQIKIASPSSVLEKSTDIPPKNLEVKNKTVTRKLKLAPALLLGLIVLALAGSAIYFLFNFLTERAPVADSKPPAAADNRAGVNEKARDITALAEKKANTFKLEQDGSRINIIPDIGATVDAINIDGTMDANCWTHVVADEQEVYRGLIRKGDKFSWQAKSNLWLKFGDADAVNMTVNGQPVRKMGAVGQVVESTVAIRGR